MVNLEEYSESLPALYDVNSADIHSLIHVRDPSVTTDMLTANEESKNNLLIIFLCKVAIMQLCSLNLSLSP